MLKMVEVAYPTWMPESPRGTRVTAARVMVTDVALGSATFTYKKALRI